MQIDSVDETLKSGMLYEPAGWVQIYVWLLRVGGVIVGTSRDCSHVGGVTTNKNDYVFVNGLPAFKFFINAVKFTVNFSATLMF